MALLPSYDGASKDDSDGYGDVKMLPRFEKKGKGKEKQFPRFFVMNFTLVFEARRNYVESTGNKGKSDNVIVV